MIIIVASGLGLTVTGALLLVALIAYETVRYAVQRHAIRHDTAHGHSHEDS